MAAAREQGGEVTGERDPAGLDLGPTGRHEYSDANYAVLGAIVAAVSGQPFGRDSAAADGTRVPRPVTSATSC